MSKTINRLSPPAFPDSVMERPEVNRAIDTEIKKSILYIHAPAGFGKTIAMSMWLSSRKLPAAWIPLNLYDDEPAVFCRYLLTALVWLDNGAAGAAKAALSDPGFTEAPFEYFFRVLSNISVEHTQGIIVIDDFHLIENMAILNTLPQAIRKLSQVHKLVVLSRLKPPVSFSDLVLKNEMGELNENGLRFTRKQIVELYKSVGIGLSFEEARTIEEKTGGWALGLGAELLSIKAHGSESFFSRATGEKYIHGYLEKEIWDKWDDNIQEFLLRTSILEDLPLELCDKLCKCGSEKILSSLTNDSGLVVCLPDGAYRYHHILRDFLRRMAEEKQFELSPLYLMAAQHMYKTGRFSAALDYYVKSGDYHALNDFVIRTLDYNFSRISTEECLLSFKNMVLNKVPDEIIEKNDAFVPICTYVYWMTGNVEQMNRWFTKSRELLRSACDNQMAGTMFALLSLDPFANPWEFLKMAPASNIKMDTVPSISITINLPYFHRSMRDFSGYLEDWDVLASQITLSFESIVGISTKISLLGISSGIFYERNKLVDAKKTILDAYSLLDEQSHPELFFAIHIQIADILFAEGAEAEAWKSVDKARVLIEKNALYLKKNLEAIVTKYRLYKGDTGAARQWLSDYAANDSWDFALYQIPQILATARAHIALGNYSPSSVLLVRLENLMSNCRRTLDQLEALILEAILHWSQKQHTQAVDTMKEAVFLAQPHGYVRMFVNEGAVIIPILQKLYNRLSSKPDQSEIAVFVRTALLLANECAEMYPGLTSSLEGNHVKLSRQQKRMLLFLAAGRNNRQICEETGLKLNTVKAHLYKLYEKLEVHTSTEAVLKSYRLGIIEKNG